MRKIIDQLYLLLISPLVAIGILFGMIGVAILSIAAVFVFLWAATGWIICFDQFCRGDDINWTIFAAWLITVSIISRYIIYRETR